MILIRAIIRPEKKDEVLAELSQAGFNAVTAVDVVGRGKQKGIKIGGVVYDEIPKTMLIMAVYNHGQKSQCANPPRQPSCYLPGDLEIQGE